MGKNNIPTRVFSNIKKDSKEMPMIETLQEKRDTFADLIKAYKVQNPVKYEMKKEKLKEKLEMLDKALKEQKK